MNVLLFITMGNFDAQIFPDLTDGSPFKLASVIFSDGPLSGFLTQKDVSDSVFTFFVPGLGPTISLLLPVSLKEKIVLRNPDLSTRCIQSFLIVRCPVSLKNYF